MSTRSEVWSLIKGCTADEVVGRQVTTSLLGDVNAHMVRGRLVSIIPYNLTTEARRHGFRIFGASVQEGTYTLEKL